MYNFHTMASLQNDEVNLRRMMRRTQKAVRESKKLLQQTRELLARFEVHSHFRVKRPDIRTGTR